MTATETTTEKNEKNDSTNTQGDLLTPELKKKLMEAALYREDQILPPAERKGIEPPSFTGEELLTLYYIKHKERCDEWIKHNPPSRKFPLVDDGKGGLQWLNRKERRKLKAW